MSNYTHKTQPSNDEVWNPPEPLPVPRIEREAEHFLNWMSLRSDGFTLNNEFYSAVVADLGIAPHRLDDLLDHLEKTGRARTSDVAGGVSVRINRNWEGGLLVARNVMARAGQGKRSDLSENSEKSGSKVSANQSSAHRIASKVVSPWRASA